jgi:predicted Zn-dependent protease
MKRAWILVLLLACLPASAQFGNLLKGLDPNKIIDTGKKLAESSRDFSEPEEVALGEGIAAGFLGAAPLSRDANLQRYVNRVGRWVALHSDRPDLPWTFGVIAGDSINAFAMPGGTVIVSEGLLKRLHSEAELAGALAHEIAHVALRHQISAIQSNMRTGALTGIGSDLVGDQINRRGGDALTREVKSKFADVGLELVKNGFILRPLDRGMEYDADRMAITLAARSGYDPYGLVGVLQMLDQAKGDGTGTSVFDTHPAASDRLAELERSQAMLDRYASQPQNEQRYRQAMGAGGKP